MRIIRHRIVPRLGHDLWHRPLDPLNPFDSFDMFDWMDEMPLKEARQIKASPYRITVDCSDGYDPDSIITQLSEDKTRLVVSAKQNEEDEENFERKAFRRTYKVPSNVDADKMTKQVNDDGNLVIEFPIKEAAGTAAVAKSQDKRKSQEMIVSEENNGVKKIRMSFELPTEVDPSKLEVKCRNRDVIIRAEDKVEQPNGLSSQVFFYRRSTLPKSIDLDSIKCTLDNKMLTIEAPCIGETKSVPRLIPIEVKHEQPKQLEQQPQQQIDSSKQ